MVTKKKTKFFKSLRFRIMVILVILGIVPGIIVTQLMIGNYKQQAIEVRTGEIRTQCVILCNQIIKENYLNDPNSESINSKLEVLSNAYGGRIMLVDRDFKVVKDTYNVDEGKILISPKVVKCFKSGEATDYRQYGQTLELAVPVRSADVPQMQGALLVNISMSAVMATVSELEQRGMLIVGIIIVLSIFLSYILAAVLVKPLARVTKSIEDLTDGYQKDEISVPDYTETELITDAFNKMLTRMKVLDESRSEFVSNVSHELKTPVTALNAIFEKYKEFVVIDIKLAAQLRDIFEGFDGTQEAAELAIRAIQKVEKPSRPKSYKLSADTYSKYFNDNDTEEHINSVIQAALEQYFREK